MVDKAYAGRPARAPFAGRASAQGYDPDFPQTLLVAGVVYVPIQRRKLLCTQRLGPSVTAARAGRLLARKAGSVPRLRCPPGARGRRLSRTPADGGTSPRSLDSSHAAALATREIRGEGPWIRLGFRVLRGAAACFK